MRTLIPVLVVTFAAMFAVTNHADAKIEVVTTTGQLTDTVQNVGKNLVNVQGLMGPGVDPHLYKAGESDVRRLAEADIIIYNGLHLEAKMSDILKQMGQRQTTVAVGEKLADARKLDSEDYPGQFDPHIWFDVKLWIDVTRTIAATLSEHDPGHAQEYEANAAAYIQRLQELDAHVRARAAELPADQRILITAHDAFRYFGRAYGFEVIGLQGLSTESEAGIKDVIRLADLITERRIHAIFIESSVPERNIKAVQQAVQSRGWDVAIGGELFSDAMGSAGTPEGTYIGMLEHNINTIVDALKDPQ